MIKVYHLPYTHPNYGFFEAFLHVEEEFIPIWAERLDWPAVVSPALKRTRCEKKFVYKLFFYMQKGFKKPIIWMGILQVYTFIILDKCGTDGQQFSFWPGVRLVYVDKEVKFRD